MMYIYTLHFIALLHLNKLRQITFFFFNGDFRKNEDHSLLYSFFHAQGITLDFRIRATDASQALLYQARHFAKRV